ncbi:MAG: type II/IV secretion system protein [Candidatus Omnitrophica bacterium]|nr:type II/IV secretion system protein [Candidatus Omnitrophota bacterium]MDE2008888.1 type II/IV secretion system protein [Candidatus Omnitrophota bacterium]MDE2213549.1 type II/IV secretion system protein [Candidatus Omnitrophota bacterium]MDE2230550.1 type II/IV secretion system protein [Candidatus Omnitrophota bacterium]
MFPLQEKYNQLILRPKEQAKSAWGGKPSTPVQESSLTTELVSLILTEAVTSRASDIHIEPNKNFIRIRFRIDGKLYNVLEMIENNEVHLLARIKVLANIPTDAVSSRKSWDSRFSMMVLGQEFDFRIATFPILLGEKMAIRILNKNSELVDLKRIGLRPGPYALLEQIIQRKSGLLVVSGPTGGGKTTTLYSILKRLNAPTVNIVTLENPVEYQIDGLNQCDINKKVSEDFTSALRATLRQDPDIILIGEIRDSESAEIALRASITGHFVLTSLHANSAIGTVMRLINMGVERHVIAYALAGAICQHLVPRICDKCRTPYTISADKFHAICEQFGISPTLFRDKSPKAEGDIHYLKVASENSTPSRDFTFYKGAGCDVCKGTGYLGMIGVFEIVQFTEDLREAVLNNISSAEVEALAVKKGFQSMAVDALEKVKSGVIRFDDIYSVLLEKLR